MQILSSTEVQADGVSAERIRFEDSHALVGMYVLTLTVVSTAIFIGNAFRPALLDDADASHAIVAREMLERSDYVVMFMNGIRYLMKAPLHYWAVAGSYFLFGQTAFATRLPDAIAMVLLTLMVFEFGRHFFSLRAGFYAGLVTATSVGMFMFTRIMIPEAIYALQFTAIFYLFLRSWTGSLDKRLGYCGCALLTALAVLTRGLIGAVFPLGSIFTFLTLTRGWNRWRELRLFSNTLIFAAIAVPWHVIAEMRAPGFLWSYFINEHVKRALGTRYPPDYDSVPLLLWLAAHLAWFFPWSVFLPFALRQLPHPRFWRSGEMSVSAQARLLLFVWAGVILGFFSLLGGSRLEYYSFGAWPAIAILLGCGLFYSEERRSPWLSRLQAALGAFGMVIAGSLGYLVWQSSNVQSTGDISQLLKLHNNSFYRLSMGHLFDLTPQAFADLRGPALGVAALFVIAFLGACLLRWKKKAIAANLAVALAMVGFTFCANAAFAVFEPHMSSKPLALEIEKYLRPEDQIVIYGEFDPGSSIAFYTHRRVYLYNGRYNNLEFGSHFPDAPRIFLTDDKFPEFWSVPERVFLFVQPELRKQAFERLSRLSADSLWLVADVGNKQVFVNHRLTASQLTFRQFLAASTEQGKEYDK